MSNITLRARGTRDIAIQALSANAYLIDCDLPNWDFGWWGGGMTHKVYRQYTFNLQVTEEDGTPIQTANVVLTNAASAEVFNVNTDASGLIAEQTVSRGYYAQATGNTLQDYGPFTLTITKAGYVTYIQEGIILDEKIDWRTALLDALTGNAAVGEVANTKTFYNTDPRTRLTGTYVPPVLTGDAEVGDVADGKTFYKDDATVQLTGTLALTGDAVVGDVATGKLFYKDDLYTQLTGSYVPPTAGSKGIRLGPPIIY